MIITIVFYVILFLILVFDIVVSVIMLFSLILEEWKERKEDNDTR